MKINLDEVKKQLLDLLNANMEGEAEGGSIQIDREGNIAVPAPGVKTWLHTLLEVKCSDEEFHLLVNPKLKFRQEIDLMDEDIPDTVEEAVDFLWEDICDGISEYESCFQAPDSDC